tara:strand:+ start:1189 stop:1449 length:261 start_codon:yes stop_codon:yes gene_type:complete
MVNLIVLTNQQVLISTIEEVPSELGEPDCKLVNPFVVKIVGENNVLEPFLMGVTKESTFMISSDKILTLTEPTPTLLEKYQDLIKE